jgi:hypothetical protein
MSQSGGKPNDTGKATQNVTFDGNLVAFLRLEALKADR